LTNMYICIIIYLPVFGSNEMEKEKDIIEEARKVLGIEASAIEGVSRRLDRRFSEAVELLNCCAGRVIVTGMGKSGLVGKKIAATLASTGTPAFYMHPGEASHGDLGMVMPSDVVLALSNSGETAELVALIPFIKRFKIKVISMTGNMSSTLAAASDIALDVAVSEEACPMGLVPTASTTATLALGDALAVSLLVKKGFRQEDFARFHPSGTLGKKLLTRVCDLMHKEEGIPVVREDTSMADAVVEMSSRRLGLTLVLDGSGGLSGVLTDGDLRRGIQRSGQGFFTLKAGEAMSRGPKLIAPEELAATALSIMEEHSITSLVVMESGGNIPLGVIHIHDILKEGIA
jgi:arabinose-5-phosphate isomerase